MPHYVTPKLMARAFTCPHCDVTAAHHWFGNQSAMPMCKDDEGGYAFMRHAPYYTGDEVAEWVFAKCDSCAKLSVWHGKHMVFPEACPVGEPNEDMPEEVAGIYREAAGVVTASPRAAAALLRLGLQTLLEQVLGEESTGGIYGDIKLLQERNVSEYLIMALDIIRVSGNESVHPGEINLNDTPDDAHYLFDVLNMVCDNLITQPRRMEEAYSRLPESKRLIKG